MCKSFRSAYTGFIVLLALIGCDTQSKSVAMNDVSQQAVSAGSIGMGTGSTAASPRAQTAGTTQAPVLPPGQVTAAHDAEGGARVVALDTEPLMAQVALPRGSTKNGAGDRAAPQEDDAPLDDSYVHSHTRPGYKRCIAGANAETPGLLECIDTELAWQDARLNKVYKQAMAQRGANDRDLLRQAQRAWLKATDTTCHWDPQTQGQGQMLDARSCRLNRTANRADALEGALLPAAASTDNQSKENIMPAQQEWNVALPAGSHVVAWKPLGPVGDRKQSVLAVTEAAAAAGSKLGEGAPRAVLLLIKEDVWRVVARNNHMVPCATCGGLAGDPFAYLRAEDAEFVVAVGGGGRERWGDDYMFAYDVHSGRWMLARVKRDVVDQESGKSKTLTLTRQDFGNVTFDAFDPAALPDVSLP